MNPYIIEDLLYSTNFTVQKMQVTAVEEFNHDEWDARLKKASGGPFLSVPWLESFRDSQCSPFYFRFVSGNDTVGLAAGLRFAPPHPFLKKIFKKLFLLLNKF